MANKSNSENRSPTIDDIINEIKRKSEHGDYIYRGERRDHGTISSALYREYFKTGIVDIEGFDLRMAQKEMLEIAKKHIGEPPKAEEAEEAEELKILTELQHYGSKTNLIDFTTDYLVAIFFACAGESKEDGIVILLEKTTKTEDMIVLPQNPRHRVIAQKSVFLYPPTGFVGVDEDNKVMIPKDLKQSLLKYLRKYHYISTETIYNDIHGFITNEGIHRQAYSAFYQGYILHNKAVKAEDLPKEQQAFKEAIKHYDTAIELNPELAIAYANRGECWLHLEDWENAKKDLMTGNNMGLDLIYGFRNDYKGGVAEFKERTGIQMPKHITVLLGD